MKTKKLKRYPSKKQNANLGGLLGGVTAALDGANPIGLAASVALPLLSNLIRQKPEPITVGATPGNYQYGGGMPDQNVSSAGFQVKGNPQKVDGNYYPELNAMLDHDEVIINMEDGPFVFSDSIHLNDTKGNPSFAALARPHLKALSRAEKALEQSKGDEQAKSTVAKTYAIIEQLRANQEKLAITKGYRNPDGTPKQDTIEYKNGGKMKFMYGGIVKHYATGGPGDPLQFQKWVNANYGLGLAEDGVYGPKTQNAYTKYAKQYAIENISAFDPVVTNPLGGPFVMADSEKKQWETVNQLDKLTPDPVSGGTDPMNQIVDPYTDPYTNQLMNFDQGKAAYKARNEIGFIPNADLRNRVEGIGIQKSLVDTKYQTPWTFGDYLKVGELTGKFSETMRPAEKEVGNFDSTQISKRSYDPKAALYQTQRNFANVRNSIDTRNIGQRNALLNAALASTINAENNLFAQYDQMNQQAGVEYENRVANQRRYNAQEMSRVNTVNSQNRAALDAARQNVFTSVGQFGEDLNRKRYATDQVNFLKLLFPEGFNSYMGTLS